MRAIGLLALTTSILATGCALHDVNPNAKPNVQTQNHFPALGEVEGDEQNDQKNSSLWWSAFSRPALDEMITHSFSANQNIFAAIERIKQAQAVSVQTRSDVFPKISAQGNISDSIEDGNDQPDTSAIGAALSWEVDVFNRIGSAALADDYETKALVYDLDALRLSLSAEVANAYFGAVAAHNRLQLLNQQLDTDKELLDLIKLRQDNGVGTKVEVLQQQSQVSESLSFIPPAQADLRVFENRLDVLLGAMPDGQNRVSDQENLSFSQDLPKIGVPSDLLLRRPDLRALHAELIAADADIASAIADRLPQITLTGSYLYTDTATFSGPVATILGAFVQPLLDWGEKKAAVERNKALYQERLALYTQLYLEAVEDVENALYQENKQREYIERLEARRAILEETVEETEALYTQGIDDYLPVLNALQNLRAVEREIISERLNLITIRINLYRAVGGSIQHSVNEESL